MTKFVFVTGGVVSSLGKGIAAASLAAILESRGVRVTNLKLDPYINVDPGTMRPFQHGEVFVTEDGAETDLDLGHYERFVDVADEQAQQLHHRPDLRERDPQGAPRRLPRRHGAGDPAHHRRDQELDHARARATPRSRSSRSAARSATSSRCRSSKRSGRWASTLGRDNVCYIHLTLVPYIAAAGRDEDQADAALGQGAARDRHPARRRAVPRRPAAAGRRARARSRCSPTSRTRRVIPALDADSIYKIPGAAARARASTRSSARSCEIQPPPADLSAWNKLVDALEHPEHEVNIAMVGKYVDLTESYKSLSEALTHAGIHTRSKVNIHYVDSEDDRARRRRRAWRAWTRSSCRAASASAASKARSRRSATRARTAFRISASASACSSR